MKKPWFKDYKQVRLNRIYSIFGLSWFKNKNILDLGCAHGDIGLDLHSLGANVTFSDVREEHLNSIKLKYPEAKTINLNQNTKYNLDQNYDLVLHLGLLHHLENWQQDLECITNFTNLMVLEVRVFPYELKEPFVYTNKEFNHNNPYNGITNKLGIFDEKHLQNHLTDLGCKYLQIDTPEMSLPSILDENNHYIKHNFGWSKNDNLIEEINENDITISNNFRRMYLIIK